MTKQPLEGELLEDSHIFLHPIRFRLLELLEEQPRHINALSSALGMEKETRLVPSRGIGRTQVRHEQVRVIRTAKLEGEGAAGVYGDRKSG